MKQCTAFDDAMPVNYDENISHSESIWVSIGHRTGTVTSSANAWELLPGPPWPGTGPAKPFFVDSLRAAREFAQSSQNLGGR